MKPPLWLEKRFLDTDKLAKDDFYSFAESDENFDKSTIQSSNDISSN